LCVENQFSDTVVVFSYVDLGTLHH